MKRCPKCSSKKENKDFFKASIRSDGLCSWCKSCMKEHQDGHKRLPEIRFKAHQREAKVRGIEFKLSFEEWLDVNQQPCHYCNNKLGCPVETQGGLDRIDNNGIYEIDNVVSCCFICNGIKKQMPYERAIKLIKLHIIAKDGNGKVCAKCMSCKTKEDFARNIKDINYTCKQCDKEYQRQRRLKMKLDKLQHQKQIMIAYEKMKLDAGDQHAVSDAANDIREINAVIDFIGK